MNNSKRKLRVQLDRTPEQLALAKAMGSNNRTESLAATEAVAAVMAAPLLQAIEQAPVISNLYSTLTYSAGTASNILLDDYFDIRARNFLSVWTASQPGGTMTNFVQGATELFVQTYPIESAVSFNKNYLRSGNIDHLAAGLTRMVQEVLLVQETNAAFVLFNSLAGARVDGNSGNTATNNIVVGRSAAADVFQMDDFNQLVEIYDNVTSSWVGGTPVNEAREITDLLGSTRWMSQIRSIAYQPQNTRAVPNGDESTVLGAPESVREQVWRAGTIPTLFDKTLHKVYEMGVGKSYNSVFGTAMGATSLPAHGTYWGGAASSAFTATSEEVVVGLNTDMFDLARLRMTEENSELTLVADDTFTQRSKKTGLYLNLTEGYVSVEGRAKCALVF